MSTGKLKKRSRSKEGLKRKVMLKAVSAHSLPKLPARLFIESPARDGRSGPAFLYNLQVSLPQQSPKYSNRFIIGQMSTLPDLGNT